MMTDRQAFGERLRRHRERRGISLERISESTKISAALFASLERGDCSKWPNGLYSRAYLRSYAEAVGLNGEDVVEEFASLFSGKVQVDGSEPPIATSRRAAGGLRLGLAEDAADSTGRLLRRSAYAGADLAVAVALAWTAHLLLDPGLWATLASGLAYQGASRVVSDEPLVCWAYKRLRASSARDEDRSPAGDDVHVGDAARTTA